jgi:hypothetical protein
MTTCVRCAVAAVAVLAGFPSHAGATAGDVLAQATIPISQARPDTGSRIRRELPKLTIPATDPYDKLTPDQMRAFRALFTNLADGDEPPYPVDGLLPIAKTLVFSLADGAIGQGDLFMTVRVDEKGEPQSTSIYATPSQRVSREAAAVLMKAKYKPGVCAGKPCTSEFPFTAKFE